MGRMLSDKPRRVVPPSAKPSAPVATSIRPQPAQDQGLKPNFNLAAAPAESGPLRKIAFYFGLALIFTRIGVVQELLSYTLGTSFYILYVLTPPPLAALLFTGGVRRTFQGRTARYWMAFYGWMVIAAGFSTSSGVSVNRVKDHCIFTP